MGDLDIDAFKHLPYFKPLYTTILRHQMQYLIEQLSTHAGEESLVLTTNLSSGAVTSLTSEYCSGFLHGRNDIKTQFTKYCVRKKTKLNKVTSDCLHRESTSISNTGREFQKHHESIQDVTNNSDSRLHSNHQEKHSGSNVVQVTHTGKKMEESVSDVSITGQNKPEEKKHYGETEGSQGRDSHNGGLENHRMESEDIEIGAVILPHSGSTVAGSLVLDCTDTETLSEEDAIATESALHDDKTVLKQDYTKETEETVTNQLELPPISQPENKTAESGLQTVWIIAGRQESAKVSDLGNKNNDRFGSLTKVKIEPSESTSVEEPAGDFPVLPSTSDYHVNSHTSLNSPNKPETEGRSRYHCSYCSQSFTTYASRKRHERRHTGETPWSCEICDLKFYRKDDLNVHIGKHSGMKPYQCPQCFVGYAKKKFLEVHMLTAHQIVM